MNSGIWSRRGRQPSNGLPCSFCSSMIFAFMVCRSFLYFSRISLMCGCSICIVRCDFTDRTKSGTMHRRTSMTRPTVGHAEDMQLLGNEAVRAADRRQPVVEQDDPSRDDWVQRG